MSISTVTPIDLNTNAMRTDTRTSNRIKSLLSIVGRIPKKFIFGLLGIVVLFGLYSIFTNMSAGPSKILLLNQKFDVIAKTQDGKTTNGKLNIQVTGAQKSSSMLVQGQSVVARNNKTFLIVTMEVTNSYLVPLYTYPIDAFRLIGADGKKYSPTTHQGNVEVRPESTKTSNVGFVVPNNQKRFKIEVGDLTNDKTVIEFSL